jgi:pimeloyl-ACP methyl ester carboxylesterase
LSNNQGQEWLATYHKGDSRLQNKRHGILRINPKKNRLEFAVQTKDVEDAPFVIVSYPVQYLREVKILEKRQKIKKQEFLELTFGDPPNIMKPLFSFSMIEIPVIQEEIRNFKKKLIQNSISPKSSSDPDVAEIFASLLAKPVEQFQQLLEDITSQIRIFTKKPRDLGKKIFTTLDPPKEYEVQEISLAGRIIRFYQSTHKYPITLVLLSPIGGKLEDYFPLLKSLSVAEINIVFLGIRGFTSPIEQDSDFKMNSYSEDLKAFLEYLGPNQKVILGVHSLLAGLLFRDFVSEDYNQIEKFIILSGVHRAPNTFRNGVKALPPTKLWGPFKGQVRKLAPKILFSKNCDEAKYKQFCQNAFSIPDKVYSDLFRDFLPKFDYTEVIQKIDKPIICIWGEEDQIIPKELRSELINLLPKQYCFHKILKGGHMFPYESPLETGRVIRSFISAKRSRIEIE